MVDLKICHGSEIRRFSNVLPNRVSYTQLCEDMPKLFPQVSAAFQIKYLDDEGEAVCISSDAELQDAISSAERWQKATLRIIVDNLIPMFPSDDGDSYPGFLRGDGLPSLSLHTPEISMTYSSSNPLPTRAIGHDDGLDDLGIFDDVPDLITYPSPQVREAMFGRVPKLRESPFGSEPPPQAKHRRLNPPADDVSLQDAQTLLHDNTTSTSTSISTAQPTSVASDVAAVQAETTTATAPKKPEPKGKKKILARRARNRISAKKSRMRKKLYHDSLQAANDILTAENTRLKQRIKELEAKVSGQEGAAKENHAQSNRNQNDVAGVSVTALVCSHRVIALLCQKKYLIVTTFVVVLATQDSGDVQLLSQVHFLHKSFCICDPNQLDNPIIYCSDSFVKLTGYPRAEILGRNCRFLQGPNTDPQAVQAIRSAIEQGCDAEVQLLNYRKDGTGFWNNFFIAALRDEQGKVVHFIGVQQEMQFPANLDIKQSARAIPASNVNSEPHTITLPESQQQFRQQLLQEQQGSTRMQTAHVETTTNPSTSSQQTENNNGQ